MRLRIERHSTEDAEFVEVVDYSATDINDKINDNSINTLVIGEKIFSRIDIKYVGEA